MRFPFLARFHPTRAAALFCVACFPIAASLHAAEPAPADEDARAFMASFEKEYAPLEKGANLANWKASVTGADADFAAAEKAVNDLDLFLSAKDRFARLKALHARPLEDALLARQLHLVYLMSLEKQLDPELLRQINALVKSVEQKFGGYRAKVGGRELTDSEVRKVLKESTDGAELRAVWEASKAIGAVVEPDLRKLVSLRNEAARKLGYADYHKLQLALLEQTQEQVLAIFDELDGLTRKPFFSLKADIDAKLAARLGIEPRQLRPWHYQDPFFQEPPKVSSFDFDSVYSKADVIAVTRRHYSSMGLSVDAFLAESDLYEKPGKNPHAFCQDMDRAGDVRVLANVVPNAYWQSTMVHEFGHAVYSSANMPKSLPFFARTDAHSLATEGFAMMEERAIYNSSWARRMGLEVADPVTFDREGAAVQRAKQLIFSRWCQVMFRFEKELYGNPSQDLNACWWALVEKYQGLEKPAGRNSPDYAAKIHVILYPAYYHNYMLGDLFASQLQHALAKEVLHVAPPEAAGADSPEVGEFFRKRVFGPGRSMVWTDFVKFATGEPLNARAFAEDIKGEEKKREASSEKRE